MYDNVHNTLKLKADDKTLLGRIRSGLYFDLEMLGMSNLDST